MNLSFSYCICIIPREFRIRLVLFLAIWRNLALWRPKILFHIKKHGIRSDVTITGLTNYKVSEEYLRMRMSVSMADTVTCTPPFVNYDIDLKDSLPPWSCCNNTTNCRVLSSEKNKEDSKTFVLFAMPWHLNEHFWDVWDMGSIGTKQGHYHKGVRFIRGQWLRWTWIFRNALALEWIR